MQEKNNVKLIKTETIFVIILRYEQHLDSSDMEEISKCISWAADICTYKVKNNKIVVVFLISYHMKCIQEIRKNGETKHSMKWDVFKQCYIPIWKPWKQSNPHPLKVSQKQGKRGTNVQWNQWSELWLIC